MNQYFSSMISQNSLLFRNSPRSFSSQVIIWGLTYISETEFFSIDELKQLYRGKISIFHSIAGHQFLHHSMTIMNPKIILYKYTSFQITDYPVFYSLLSASQYSAALLVCGITIVPPTILATAKTSYISSVFTPTS